MGRCLFTQNKQFRQISYIPNKGRRYRILKLKEKFSDFSYVWEPHA